MNEPSPIHTGNPELDLHLIAIGKTLEKQASARLEQAWRIGKIDSFELYKKAGFESISECFKKYFDAEISDKTIKALSRIGRTCLEWKNGQVRSIIAHDVIIDGKPTVIEYSYTVLNQILSIGAEKLIEYDASGQIYPEMTLAQAKEFMQSLKQLEASDEPSGSDPASDGAAEPDPEEQINEGEYQERLKKVKKALKRLADDFSFARSDADALKAFIDDYTFREGELYD